MDWLVDCHAGRRLMCGPDVDSMRRGPRKSQGQGEARGGWAWSPRRVPTSRIPMGTGSAACWVLGGATVTEEHPLAAPASCPAPSPGAVYAEGHQRRGRQAKACVLLQRSHSPSGHVDAGFCVGGRGGAVGVLGVLVPPCTPQACWSPARTPAEPGWQPQARTALRGHLGKVI